MDSGASKREQTVPTGSFAKSLFIPCLLLLALTLAVYWQLLTHNFLGTWDDPDYVTRNPAVQGFTLRNLKLAFSTYYVGNYAPVQIISYMLDYTLWGMKPAGFLGANILYHYLSGVLLFSLLFRTGLPLWGAFFGAALFLVHPAQVENVAWVAQRKTLLAMLFTLSAFHGWLSYRDTSGRGRVAWYLLSIISFVLALLAKSVAVVFPLMLLCYDHLLTTEKSNVLTRHRDKIPFLLAAGAVAVLAMVTQQPEHSGGRAPYPDNPFFVIPVTMLPILAQYTRILFWPNPADLSIMYFFPIRTQLDPVVIGALCLALSFAVIGFFLYQRDRRAFYWYLAIFIGLLPVSQIIPLITLINDRYLYFPMLGIAGLVACGYGWFRERNFFRSADRILVISLCTIVVALGWASYSRSKVWHNAITLFRDATEKAPDERDPWSRLAEGHVAAGDLVAARMYYELSAQYGALDEDAAFNLSRIYLGSGRLEKALELMLQLGNSKKKADFLSVLWGEYQYRRGAYPEAEEYLLAYLAKDPQSVHGLYLLGQVYLMTGYLEQARELYYRAVEFGSLNPGVLFAVSCVEAKLGNSGRSLDYLGKAFEQGMTAEGFREGEQCLEPLAGDPRYSALIRRYFGER